jgi:hypothetical protein
MPVMPDCHDGLEYTELGPPLAATKSVSLELLELMMVAVQPVRPAPAQESFQVASGMYDFADSVAGVPLLVVFQ